jgi:flagellin-like hook-associated protein FlgL
MPSSIIGIPTTRVSDIFIRERLLRQVQHDQSELFRTQMQLSTGRRFEAPSEDPIAALKIMDLQRLIERKEQVYSNLATNQSYLASTDSALSNVSSLIASARGMALGVLGTTATDFQRSNVALQIDQTINQLVDTGNQKFRGRYLFTGSRTLEQPFAENASGFIEYTGNEESIRSYADIDLLFETNMHGNEVFGAISEVVKGSIDLDPVLTYNTRLTDLRGGLGISDGSIAISDGSTISIVDITPAETIGDLAALLRANPPTGAELEIEITPDGLWIRIDSGDLSIREVGGGTIAGELGIRAEIGVGTTPIVGRDLDPVVRTTMRLDDVFGTRSRAIVRSSGSDNDLIFEADVRGTALDGVTISFQDTAPAKGAETVAWDDVAMTLTIGIRAGETQALDVVAAVNAAGIPLAARLDPLDNQDDGEGLIELATTGTTNYGEGQEFDQTSGLQIVNGGQTHTISLTTTETVEDVLNILNGSGAGVLAEINRDQTGIDIRSRLSGTDFMIGENGGTTATELGLRTFTTGTFLEELNYGFGVDQWDGVDFTIQRADGVTLDIDIGAAETIGGVLDLINTHPNNADGALVARLAAYGNGIELVDDSPGSGRLTVTKSPLSLAAIYLGLVPEDEEEAQSQTTNGTASISLELPGADNDLIIRARDPGTYGNVEIIFEDTGANPDSVTYDPVAGTLTFEITLVGPPPTNANDIITLVQNDPAANAAFEAVLYLGAEPLNDGTGAAAEITTQMTGGEPEVLTGTDTNSQETEGLFTALLRLRDALQANDLPQARRAIELLDAKVMDMNFARAELGARQQGLDVLKTRMDSEEIELREALSIEYDVDMVKVVSDLTARQAAFEASLRSTANLFQLSLLNYL